MRDSLSGLKLFSEALPFILSFRRTQHRYVFADDFFSGVAVYALGPAIPSADDTVDGLAENRIIGALHDGGKLGSHFRGAQPFGHVFSRQKNHSGARFVV